MYADILDIDGFESLLDDEDFITDYRDQNGAYRLGHFEDDPQMLEYDEMVDLGQSLATC